MMHSTDTAPQSYNRYTLTDERFIMTAENALEWERRRLGSKTLAEGFISKGMCGSSEGDWFMIAEKKLGIADDFSGYISARVAYDTDSPTDAARSAITEFLLTGESSELPEYELDELAVNELIWVGAARRVCGGDFSEYTAALEERQSIDGSFGMRGDSDPDLTAMSLILLPRESEAAENALDCLSEMWQNGSIDSCEAAAWVVIGYCSQDICPNDSAALATASDGIRPMDMLTTGCLRSDGGFSHELGGDGSESLPTEQTLLAFAALAEYNAGGKGLFDEVYVKTDIYTQHNISGERFDEADISLTAKLDSSACNNAKLTELLQRAELFGAEEKYKSLITEKLEKSGEQLKLAEELNAETREYLYPPEEVSIIDLSRLIKHNRRAAELCVEDRTLLLAQSELEKREKRLYLYLTAGIITAVLGTVIIVVKRKGRK